MPEGICVTSFVSTTEVRLLQPSKILMPKVTEGLTTVTDSKPLHLLNASCCMSSNDSGRTIVFSALHPLKAAPPIVFAEDKSIEDNAVQLRKEFAP